MKVEDYVAHLKTKFPSAEVSLTRNIKRHNWVLSVLVRHGQEWHDFASWVGDEGDELDSLDICSVAYEQAITDWLENPTG